MDVKKCSKLPPSARRNALHRFLTIAVVAQMYLSSIAALISSAAVLRSSMDAGLILQTWSLTHSHRKLQRPRNFQQLQNDSFSFEQVQDGLGVVSSCTILLPDIDLTNDRWIASSQTRSWADHQRYRLHQCWPAFFLHHPFHNQPISIHESNKFMSSPCYSFVSNMPPCLWDTIAPRRHHILNFRLGWRGHYLSSLSRSKELMSFCLQMVTILNSF